MIPLLAFAGVAAASSSSKRGLVFVPSPDHTSDNSIWIQRDSDLTWYYNYESTPSPAFSSKSQSDFEFVPMMWGLDDGDTSSTSFLDSVTDLLDSGVKISHVLGFNEPDAPNSQGGSNILPKNAAKAWIANFEPLAKKGVKLGLPACTGGWGSLPWLKQFLGNCSEIISKDSDKKKNCTWDFLPVHWYDNFEGLASHIGERRATWPGVEIWVTEYALANQPLETTQSFFNQSVEWFDKSDFIGRYSYFGAFRSDDSNVGADAVFLNNGGELTDIGAWYLGMDATGVDPQSGRGASLGVGRGMVGLLGGFMMVLAMMY